MTGASALAVTAASTPCPSWELAQRTAAAHDDDLCDCGGSRRVPVPVTEPCPNLYCDHGRRIAQHGDKIPEGIEAKHFDPRLHQPPCETCEGTQQVASGWASSFMPGDPVMTLDDQRGAISSIDTLPGTPEVSIVVDFGHGIGAIEVAPDDLVLLVPECNTNPLRAHTPLRYPTP